MNVVKRLKSVRKPVLIVICVVVVAVITGAVFLITQMNAQGKTTTTVQKATAEKGSVSSTVTGIDLDVTAPKTGETPQSALAANDTYASSLSWNCATSAFQADTDYTAALVLTVKDGFSFYDDIVPTVSGATITSTVLSDASGNSNAVLLIKAAFAKTASDSGSSSSSSGKSTTPSSSGGSSSSSSSGSSSSGSSSSSSSGSSSSSSTSNKQMTAFTIISNDDATAALSINEDDIINIKKGQAAAITINERDNSVLVPATALQERGNITFVYTSLDSSGNPSGET